MDCNKCKQEMVNMFDSDVNQAINASLEEHLLQCPECASEYRETIELMSMLKPKALLRAPFLLKQNIIHQLSMEETKMKNKTSKTIKLSLKTKRIISIAAVVTLIMLVIPFVGNNNGFMNSTAKAANNLIESSIKATQLIKSMVIKLKARTVAQDNFALVGTEYDMVEHTIWKSFEKPEKWRIDKGERVVVFDGKNQYLWMPKFEEGIKAGINANFTEWFKILLDPESILLKEKANTKDKDSKVIMDENDGELHMTITSKARGNFMNDYSKNKSIEESDNSREYTFDSNTKLLKALKVFILEGKKKTLVLEIEHIDYNVSIDPSVYAINVPQGFVWKEISTDFKNERFRNITSKRAAEQFFEAIANNNWESINDVWPLLKMGNVEKVAKFKQYFGGLKIIKIGEPFKSGLYPGEFVPYEIKFLSGEVKKMNLAVRNDNPKKVWMIDGGL